MDLYYRNEDLREICCERHTAAKILGDRMAEILRRRIEYMRAAENLSIYMTLPRSMSGTPRLSGECDDHYRLDLIGEHDLLFSIHHDSIPRTSNGVDLIRTTSLLILEIAKYC